MHGWRLRIGVMLPSSCTVYEPEFAQIVSTQNGIYSYTSRLFLKDTGYEGLAEMNKRIEDCSEQLATIDPDIVCYMCTAGSFIGGSDGEQRIIDTISKHVKCPIVTTSGGVVSSLKNFDATKIAMLAPYDKEVVEREVFFFSQHGIKVKDYLYQDIPDNIDRGKQLPEITYNYAKKLKYQGVDAILLSCGNIRSIEIIETLEKDVGLPVISSVTATAWKILRTAGIKDKINGYGKLLSDF